MSASSLRHGCLEKVGCYFSVFSAQSLKELPKEIIDDLLPYLGFHGLLLLEKYRDVDTHDIWMEHLKRRWPYKFQETATVFQCERNTISNPKKIYLEKHFHEMLRDGSCSRQGKPTCRAIYQCFPLIHLTPLIALRNVLNMKSTDVYLPCYEIPDHGFSFYGKYVDTLVINSVQCKFILQRPRLLEALKMSVISLHLHQACSKFYSFTKQLIVHLLYFGKLEHVVLFNMTMKKDYIIELFHLLAGHGDNVVESIVNDRLIDSEDTVQDSDDNKYDKSPETSYEMEKKISSESDFSRNTSSTCIKESDNDVTTEAGTTVSLPHSLKQKSQGGKKQCEYCSKEDCYLLSVPKEKLLFVQFEDAENIAQCSCSVKLDDELETTESKRKEIDYEDDDTKEDIEDEGDFGHDFDNSWPDGDTSSSSSENSESDDEDLMDFIFGPEEMDNDFNAGIGPTPSRKANPYDTKFYDQGSESNINILHNNSLLFDGISSNTHTHITGKSCLCSVSSEHAFTKGLKGFALAAPFVEDEPSMDFPVLLKATDILIDVLYFWPKLEWLSFINLVETNDDLHDVIVELIAKNQLKRVLLEGFKISGMWCPLELLQDIILSKGRKLPIEVYKMEEMVGTQFCSFDRRLEGELSRGFMGIRELNVGFNTFNPDAFRFLLCYLKNDIHLRKLYIGECHFNKSRTTKLANVLAENGRLEVIGFSGNNMSECSSVLEEIIVNNTNLNTLYIANCVLGPDVVSRPSFIDTVRHHSSLRKLSLVHNNLGDSACQFLRGVCADPFSLKLKLLDLGENKIKSEPLHKMVEELTAIKTDKEYKGFFLEHLLLTKTLLTQKESTALKNRFRYLVKEVLLEVCDSVPGPPLAEHIAQM